MGNRAIALARGALAAWCVLGAAAPGHGQDLEPKAYSASPTGVVFVVVGVSRSTGGILVDPTLPLADVNAKIGAAPLAAGYTFDLAGKLALITGAVPYALGRVSGKVGEDAREVTRSGLTDARVKLSVNLSGNPAMGAREFARTPRNVIVGTSLTVTAPSGQYSGTKLINLGTNRWSFKPEVGVSVPKGPWDFDAYLGVWLFTGNDDFYPGGQSRTQEHVVALQGHASYTFRPKLWAAFDATWYQGGSTRTANGTPSSAMNNTRLGGTVSFPFGHRRSSFKVAYSSGILVRTGSNVRTLSAGWQWAWFTK